MDKQPFRDASEKVRTRLFISHSSEDEDLANALATLIRSTLRVENAMRCTSDFGSGLPPGEDVPQTLRRDLGDSDVVLWLLTPSSVTSSYVLMELGAAWGLNRYVIPILGAGLSAEDIPEPFGQRVHNVRADNETAMAEVLSTVSRKCGMPVDCTAGGLQGSVKQFAEKASSHRSRLLNPSGPWRDLGNFPEFLPAIIEAIKNAPRNSGIQVACDYVGYGMFNAASMSDEYRNALIQARSRGCTVQMLVLGTEPWKQALAHVPDNDENLFERLMQEAEFRERIEAFAYRLRKLDLSPPRTWKRASHLEALVQVELIYENMLRAAGIQITIVHGPLPLYLWITKSSAIWVLCPLEPRIRFPMIWSDLLSDGKINVANPLDEHGYLSCDERTVTRFHHVWHQYKAVESRAASA